MFAEAPHQCSLMSHRRRWWPPHRGLGRGPGQSGVLHLASWQLLRQLWRGGDGENPPHVGSGCRGQIRKGKKVEECGKVKGKKLKGSFGKILVINWAVTWQSEPEPRVINTEKTFDSWLFLRLWQISRFDPEPETGIRLHLSDGHTSDLSFQWLADRLGNTKWTQTGVGWVADECR